MLIGYEQVLVKGDKSACGTHDIPLAVIDFDIEQGLGRPVDTVIVLTERIIFPVSFRRLRSTRFLRQKVGAHIPVICRVPVQLCPEKKCYHLIQVFNILLGDIEHLILTIDRQADCKPFQCIKIQHLFCLQDYGPDISVLVRAADQGVTDDCVIRIDEHLFQVILQIITGYTETVKVLLQIIQEYQRHSGRKDARFIPDILAVFVEGNKQPFDLCLVIIFQQVAAFDLNPVSRVIIVPGIAELIQGFRLVIAGSVFR